MKSKQIIYLLVLTLFPFSSCKDDDSTNQDPTPTDTIYHLNLYRPSAQESLAGLKLQSSLYNQETQISSFGTFNSDYTPNAAEGLYIFDKSKKEEAILLFDQNREPAFIYGVDSKTNTKKPAIVEFENISATSFYVRIFHYDWTNRLGTLLFESIIEAHNGVYKSTPTFQISNVNFSGEGTRSFSGGGAASSTPSKYLTKSNKSFPAPLLRLESVMTLQTATSSLPNARKAGTTDDINEFVAGLDDLRNSNISGFLRQAQQGGAILTFLGVATYLTVSPALGTVLAVGGIAIALTSLANDIVISDRYKNLEQELDDLATDPADFSDETTESDGNFISTYNGYVHDFKEHMLEQYADVVQNYETLTDWLEKVTQEEFVEADALNDLPDAEGVLQFGLSWTTDNTDIDLWVTDPAGERIYYGHEASYSGGYLDRDDTDGYGPENIYWVKDIPDGTYTVQVHYYGPSDGPATPYTVKIVNGLGISQSFQGVLSGVDDLATVATVVKNGQALAIQ